MPSEWATYQALDTVASILDASMCWRVGTSYHFRLNDDGETLAVTPDSAARFRLEACRWTRPGTTLWVRVGDHERLAALVEELTGHMDKVR